MSEADILTKVISIVENARRQDARDSDGAAERDLEAYDEIVSLLHKNNLLNTEVSDGL